MRRRTVSEAWTAIVLAGQRPGEDAFAKAHGVAAKALIRVGGEPMLGRVVRTLLGCPSVGKVLILAQRPDRLLDGATEWLRDAPGVRMARSGDGISRSIEAAAGHEAAFPLLVTTADHALLTAAMVETFLAGAGDADVSELGFGVGTENAHANGLGKPIMAVGSNLLSALSPRPLFDVILSSPPSGGTARCSRPGLARRTQLQGYSNAVHSGSGKAHIRRLHVRALLD